MKKVFNVEFSNKHDFDFGTRYQSKLVSNQSDPKLGLESKETYYIWGTKELSGDIEIDPNDYNIKKEEFTVVDKETGEQKVITTNRIMGLK